MLFPVVMTTLILVQGLGTDASLNLLPILRGSKPISNMESSSSHVFDALPQTAGNNAAFISSQRKLQNAAAGGGGSNSVIGKRDEDDDVSDDDASNVDDITKNVIKQLTPPYYNDNNNNNNNNAMYNNLYDRRSLAEDALNRLVFRLFKQFAKYELNNLSEHQGGRSVDEHTRAAAAATGLLSKRLWGQRRNGRARIASFGTKLSPNRKILGSSGSTLLRYGRSTDQE